MRKQYNDVQCDWCGIIFNKRNSYIKKHNFCCRECYHKYQSKYLIGDNNKNSIPKTKYLCTTCGKEIFMLESTAKSKKNIFCSKQCRFDYDKQSFVGSGNPNYRNGNIQIECLYCGDIFERPFHQNGRAKYCSKKCKDKHWSEYVSKLPEVQERLIKHGIKIMKSQKTSFTKPERIVLEYLNKNNIENIPQYPMYDKFVVDFYLPKYDMVVEVLGDYWHGNPRKYTDDKLSENQKHNISRDKYKKDFLTHKGHKLHMIWEYDIYNFLEETMSFLK